MHLKYYQTFVLADILQSFFFLIAIFSWAWWGMPTIPATQEAEAERIGASLRPVWATAGPYLRTTQLAVLVFSAI